MKKVYRMENLCCANCARKIEEGIKKIPGVTDAKITFMTMKLTLEGEDCEATFFIFNSYSLNAR